MATTTVQDSPRPVVDTLNQLLVGLGFAAEEMNLPLELVIDRFDQWNNPMGAVVSPTTCCRADIDTLFGQAA